MNMTKKLSSLNLSELSTAHGGLKWQGRRRSLNVEDRRPGAPSIEDQRKATKKYNKSIGAVPRKSTPPLGNPKPLPKGLIPSW